MAGIKRKRRWGVWIFLLLGVVAITAYVKTRPEKKLKVSVTAVGRGDVAVSIAPISAGEVYPKAKTTISAEIAGKLKELRKRKGDFVNAGEVIAVIDTTELKTRLAQAQAQVLAAKSGLKQSSLRTNAAKVAFERIDSLVKQGASAESELERADAELGLSTEGVSAAQAQLYLAQSAVTLAQQSIEKGEIRAPFSGILGDPASAASALSLTGTSNVLPSGSRLEVGSQVAPGVALFELIDNSALHIEAAFDELDAGRLQVGAKAQLRFDALPGVKDITGTVVSLDPTFTKDSKGARMRVVQIALPNDPRLIVGMSVDIEIEVERREHVIALSSHLIAGRGVKRTVWVVEEGRAQKREVKVGLSGWSESEVTEGLKEGDLVITSLDAEGLAEGVLLDYTPPKGASSTESVSVKPSSKEAQ